MVAPPPAQASEPLLLSSAHYETAHSQEPKQSEEEEEEGGEGEEEEEGGDASLDRALRHLDCFLFLLGFHQTSPLSCILSWAAFLVVGVLAPVLILELCHCPGCEEYQIIKFELYIVASLAALAAVSLLCISHNLRKRGLRNFLFVDRFHGQTIRLHKEYAGMIMESFRLLLFCTSPVLLLKIIREIVRLIYVKHESWVLSLAIFLALAVSWTYLTVVFLSACILFNLVCNLQVIHFEDYGKLFEGNSNALILLEEHMRLRHHLSKISHRFRINLLLSFFLVTASQFVTLFQTTSYHEIINFINGGDFAVSSVVEVVGLTICLHAAAKISHRAQGVAAIASRWHAMITCTSTDGSHTRLTNSVGNFEAYNHVSTFINYPDSDLESLDSGSWVANSYLTSNMTSFQKRLALVLYLQSNPGGLTIFGWTVDRALINIILSIELSLILFVLSKTIIL